MWEGLGQVLHRRGGGWSSQLYLALCLVLQVQRLGDMHMESLLAQHSSLSLARCSLVEEYLLSGRREENVEQEDRCSDRRSIQAQQKFQVCHSNMTLWVILIVAVI